MAKQKNSITKIIQPLGFEFGLKDLIQIIIGASILAIPVGLTEETWSLGEALPWLNVMGILAVSVLFMATFVYYHYHRHYQRIGTKGHWTHYVKRVIATYFVSFLVVAILLSLIQVAPWTTEWALAVKRVIIATFPASMSAVIADTLK